MCTLCTVWQEQDPSLLFSFLSHSTFGVFVFVCVCVSLPLFELYAPLASVSILILWLDVSIASWHYEYSC